MGAWEIQYNVVVGLLVVLCLRLTQGAHPRRVSAALAAAAVAFVLGPAWAISARGNGFAGMRVLAYGVFVHLPALLFGLAWQRRKYVKQGVLLALSGATLLAVALDAFVLEPSKLEVRRVRVLSAKLRRGFRVLLIADLQTDHPGEREAMALSRGMAEHPDLVLFAGDYVQRETSETAATGHLALREIIARANIHPRLGAFAVEGNVDWAPSWPLAFRDTGVRALTRSERIDLGELVLTTFTLRDSFDTRLETPPEAGFTIALGHCPDFALGKVRADLLVAGHTHGGQVQLPWIGPLITLSHVPREWAHGTTGLSGGRTLVVSRGVGMERHDAPRLRFMCAPELVVIDVIPTR